MRPIRPETPVATSTQTANKHDMSPEGAAKALVLDIGIDSTRVKFLETERESHHAPLVLPAEGRPLITTRERRGSISLSGSPSECLGAFLESAKAELPLKRYSITVGNHEDPLLPFREKFESALRFFDSAVRANVGHLTIATRSPLIITAAPIFFRNKARTAIIIAIESDKDQVSRRFTPSLPRVSERLRTAKALRALGVDVTLQVSPILPRLHARPRAVEFAEALIATGCQILVTSLAQVAAPGEYPELDGCNEFGHLLVCEELTRRGYRGHRLDPQAGVDRAA